MESGVANDSTRGPRASCSVEVSRGVAPRTEGSLVGVTGGFDLVVRHRNRLTAFAALQAGADAESEPVSSYAAVTVGLAYRR